MSGPTDGIGGAGANLPVLRGHNTALVLELLRQATVGDGPGVSRAELAERTGLTPQAVSKIVARLRADGLADEAGRTPSTGGKPRTLLRLVRTARYAVGVHLDRDELTTVLVDLAGEPVTARTVPFDLGAPPETLLSAVATRVRDVVAGVPAADVLGAGVAAPGPLDHARGVLHRVTGFPGWDGYPLRDALADRLSLPVVLDKDTNTAALAVQAARPDSTASFAYLHLATGLGAGLVLGGTLYRGARTGAGEFGHQTVELAGPLCGCGNRGCLEALCLVALRRRDAAGAARLLGVGAANLVALLDIDHVVLGGRAVLAAPDVYTRHVAATLALRAGHPVPVSVAPDAPDAPRLVAVGAARLALRGFARAGGQP
ncbi:MULTISPECIES: ROK family transcriptional regulator [Streptomycetaceae]|uniref:ROK family transcriptional regulator n=1 Tax=Streptantibioticus cattleyicolor (strain ATCC 35852 / DSM 46488 / JCM 4925 / NBRC 14057 / NRRL 8057) TaxID=1003195 RepID=F8JTC6_STREN|nr:MULTISPECIES: ROK family transcriptional regulator [Streptomycetaceae]AEW94276.1 ROK family transcriptional regulator [Streptantibioticus cattleyicolor NRRL 8057 = DSM 46488]MYS58933.1 ROK family protein [Streptomyces sp. SID5468]CCB74633.1 putative ROK-family transcriptional regulator [Streptantibioticus cattleyicolor NRRL 8057 = DSM 46488]